MDTGVLEEISSSPSPVKAYTNGMQSGNIQLELKKIQRQLQPCDAIIQKNAEIKLELEKMQRPQKTESVCKGGLKQCKAEIVTEIMHNSSSQCNCYAYDALGSYYMLTYICISTFNLYILFLLRFTANTFSIFGINVGGVDLLRKRDSMNPEQKRSESTGRFSRFFDTFCSGVF